MTHHQHHAASTPAPSPAAVAASSDATSDTPSDAPVQLAPPCRLLPGDPGYRPRHGGTPDPRDIERGIDPLREWHATILPEGYRALDCPQFWRAIPLELKGRDQWVLFGWSKVPLRCGRSGAADTTDPSTWGAFREGADRIASMGSQFLHGVGFVFSVTDPYVGIDIDDCLDPGTREITIPGVDHLIEELGSYTEVSVSGTGLHIIVRGQLAADFPRGPVTVRTEEGVLVDLEIYDHKRYFALTGEVWRSDGADPYRIADAQEVFDRWMGIASEGSEDPAALEPAAGESPQDARHEAPSGGGGREPRISRRRPLDHQGRLGASSASAWSGGRTGFTPEELEAFGRGRIVPHGLGHFVLVDLAVRYHGAGVPIEDVAALLDFVQTTSRDGEVHTGSDRRREQDQILRWLLRGDRADRSEGSEAGTDLTSDPLERQLLEARARAGSLPRWARFACDLLGDVQFGHPSRRDVRVSAYSYYKGHQLGHGGPGAAQTAHQQAQEPAEPELAYHPCTSPRAVIQHHRLDARTMRALEVRCRECEGCRADYREGWLRRTLDELATAGRIEAMILPLEHHQNMAKRISRAGGRFVAFRLPPGEADAADPGRPAEVLIAVWPQDAPDLGQTREIGFRLDREAAEAQVRDALERLDWDAAGRRITASRDWGGPAPAEPEREPEWENARIRSRMSVDDIERQLRRVGAPLRHAQVHGPDGTFRRAIVWRAVDSIWSDPDHAALWLIDFDLALVRDPARGGWGGGGGAGERN